jgi:hypothetical protein
MSACLQIARRIWWNPATKSKAICVGDGALNRVAGAHKIKSASHLAAQLAYLTTAASAQEHYDDKDYEDQS